VEVSVGKAWVRGKVSRKLNEWAKVTGAATTPATATAAESRVIPPSSRTVSRVCVGRRARRLLGAGLWR